MNVAFKKQINRYTRNSRRENPQLYAMFENKMWDSIKIVLDKCRNELDGGYDFSKLDPPTRNIQKHPLMLMARSGQETLLKHDTTQKLLDLKWRFLPRFTFYFNLFFYLLFMILFATYSYQLSNYYMSASLIASTNDETSTRTNLTELPVELISKTPLRLRNSRINNTLKEGQVFGDGISEV